MSADGAGANTGALRIGGGEAARTATGAMRRVMASAVLVAAAVAGAAAQAQTCLKADDEAVETIRGTLGTIAFVHPGNGAHLTAYVVRLAAPVCADVTEPDDKVERVRRIARIQLAGDFDAAKVRRLIGKRVVARGTLFGQHTVYHLTPVVMAFKTLDAAR
jgi:hypothetical protein